MELQILIKVLTDIFATKGVEYIFVILFLFALILFWKWVKPKKSVEENQE